MLARLIQTNDGFNLYNVLEIRYFLNQLNLADDIFIISDEIWTNAKLKLINKFGDSTKLELCKNLIKDFEATNSKKKYKSDLEVFIRESKLEDFVAENGETVFVSTIHKAKGKEFDNVFLMLENYNSAMDKDKRLLYVAMTRAKQNLIVHYNSNFLDNLSVENLEKIIDNKIYLPPNELAVHLYLKDVWLDYFIHRQDFISDLKSGDILTFNGDECLNLNGQSVLKFSRKFTEKIEHFIQQGYHLKNIKVNFIVYWLKEGTEKEVKIILPEIYFEKLDDLN